MMLRHLFKRAFSSAKRPALKEMDSFIWIDLEMTGLEVENHTILETACIITTADLNPVHEGLSLVIYQPEDVLQAMNSWSLVQHAKTGLTSESRNSKISLSEADKILYDYITLHSDPGGVRFLAGSSVYMDKRFLEKYMPISNTLLHYRLLDISSLKILCKQWYPSEYSKFANKKCNHRALDDILNSLKELKELQKIMFKNLDSLNLRH